MYCIPLSDLMIPWLRQHLSVFTAIFSVKEAYFASYKVCVGFCPDFPSILSCPLYKLLPGLINISHCKVSDIAAGRVKLSLPVYFEIWVCRADRQRDNKTNKFVTFCSKNLILLVPIVWTFGFTLSSHKKYHYCPGLTTSLTGFVGR